MRLSEVQKRFKDTMLDHPKVLDDPPQDFAALFKSGNIPLPTRLKVYRNNIVGSLTDVMMNSHPLLEKLVGREFLEMMARHFVLENPPTQGCLSFYGAAFGTFIENYEPAKAMPYLPDMTRLEIAMNEAYYAPDDEPMTATDLASTTPESLKLALRKSARLISSKYPLTDIRDFCTEDDPAKTLNIDTGGVRLMIYRPALDSVIVRLNEAEYAMLGALMQETALEEALKSTLNEYKGFDFQGFLQRHIALETFSAPQANV